ncbi:bactofilin family protein [Pseudomaricurvus sp.]|uniref:bactofilin family protein n=1 Tax=Pseudomaricurvus sp. TaxID=2004510 RepID=UPI003F6BD507
MGFSSGGTTLISKSTELTGDVKFSGSLEIEGRVKGNIYAEEGADARVRIMEKGFVEGDICVPTIIINGSVNGDVHSAKHIELAAKATVTGNVHYNMIEMVKGAQVNGSLLYTKPSSAKEDTKSATDSSGGKSSKAKDNSGKDSGNLEVVANT